MWNTWGGTATAVQYLYLSNHGCEKFAGEFVTGPELGTYLDVLDEHENGLPLIRVYNKEGCAGLAGTVSWHQWSERAGSYQESRRVSCGCPDSENEKRGRHPACP